MKLLDEFNLTYKSEIQFYIPAKIKNETFIISIKFQDIKYIIICTRTLWSLNKYSKSMQFQPIPGSHCDLFKFMTVISSTIEFDWILNKY